MKNIWNFYQRKLREVSSIKFSEAKSIYQEYLKEIEMTKNTSEIMFGNIKENEILKIKNLSATMENIEKAEQDVLREIGIDEINQIIIKSICGGAGQARGGGGRGEPEPERQPRPARRRAQPSLRTFAPPRFLLELNR